ncbi:MAG: cell division protein SepF [Mogibacterium sp.]|nr:cell division protein SepF [Mogibacterium sp.]
MSFMDKMKDLVGIGEDFEEEMEVSQEEIDAYKRELATEESATAPQAAAAAPVSRTPFSEIERPMQRTPVGAMGSRDSLANASGQFRMVVIEPKNLDECKKLVDNMRGFKPIIVNLERVETDMARKMFDFLNGATYALEGSAQKINQNIYIFAPKNVNIKAMVDRATEAGKPTNASPWQ